MYSSSTHIPSTSQNIPDNGKNIKIIYQLMGADQEIYLPYDNNLIVEMTNLNVTLIKDVNGERETVNITHQPGIPYMCSALELGGEYIYVVNCDNGLEKKYPADIPPKFCVEVL